mmetsp:Transcript_44503/g.125919  ORF Transcript_44503/g.125919 Transcript_44503/m.125919 type:complete len:182 (-) Transcript_44503:64-609(-)
MEAGAAGAGASLSEEVRHLRELLAKQASELVQLQTREAQERSRAQRAEDRAKELEGKFMAEKALRQNMEFQIRNEAQMAETATKLATVNFKIPKRNRSAEEMRHRNIGLQYISTLYRAFPTIVQQALYNLFIERRSLRSFAEALAWLVSLRTQPIDWVQFQSWLEQLNYPAEEEGVAGVLC